MFRHNNRISNLFNRLPELDGRYKGINEPLPGVTVIKIGEISMIPSRETLHISKFDLPLDDEGSGAGSDKPTGNVIDLATRRSVDDGNTQDDQFKPFIPPDSLKRIGNTSGNISPDPRTIPNLFQYLPKPSNEE